MGNPKSTETLTVPYKKLKEPRFRACAGKPDIVGVFSDRDLNGCQSNTGLSEPRMILCDKGLT